MEQAKVCQATLFFAGPDRDTAGLVGRAVEESLRLVRDHWGLAPVGELRIYVMTSWAGFLFHAAPWPRRLGLGLAFPLWAARVSRLWRVAGGWTQRFGRRLAVGVKPPRLIRAGDRSLGARVFLPEENMEEKVRHLTCHEVTHACSGHLKLPAWLNEGLSMYMVDLLLGKPTVLPATVAALAAVPVSSRRRRYPAFSPKNREEFIRYFILGYWRVRFLEETRPGLLKKLLAEKYRPGAWREALAAAFPPREGLDWAGLDRLAAEHFQGACDKGGERLRS